MISGLLNSFVSFLLQIDGILDVVPTDPKTWGWRLVPQKRLLERSTMSNLFIKCMGNEQFYKLKLIQEINKELNTCISDKILFAALKEGTECY